MEPSATDKKPGEGNRKIGFGLKETPKDTGKALNLERRELGIRDLEMSQKSLNLRSEDPLIQNAVSSDVNYIMLP